MTLHPNRTGTPTPDTGPTRPGLLRFTPRPAAPPSSGSRFAPRGTGEVLRFPPEAPRAPEGPAARRAALGAALRQSEHLPAKLRLALALACESERPVCTVARLATMTGCDRRTLWNQWRNVVGRDAGIRLEDFLHWQLLLRAAAIKSPGLAWADVAERLGVHPHTVARLARQLTGRTLREMTACGEAVVATEFETDFLPHLLAPDAGTPAARRAS